MKVTKERSCLVVNRVILCVIKKRICDVSPLASFFRRSLIIWPDRQKPTFQETTTRQEDRNKDDGVSGKMTKSGLLGQGGRVSREGGALPQSKYFLCQAGAAGAV